LGDDHLQLFFGNAVRCRAKSKRSGQRCRAPAVRGVLRVACMVGLVEAHAANVMACTATGAGRRKRSLQGRSWRCWWGKCAGQSGS
jgi:hypothetical protein